MGYVSESNIKEKIAEIEKLNLDLKQYMLDFINHVDEIQDLLVGLKVCLNTTGGVARIKELANIEFDTASFNNIINKIGEINITYTRRKETLNTVIFDKAI